MRLITISTAVTNNLRRISLLKNDSAALLRTELSRIKFRNLFLYILGFDLKLSLSVTSRGLDYLPHHPIWVEQLQGLPTVQMMPQHSRSHFEAGQKNRQNTVYLPLKEKAYLATELAFFWNPINST